jgi:glucokinase
VHSEVDQIEVDVSSVPDNLAIGLDIGGTETKAVVVDTQGNRLIHNSEPTALAGQAGRDDVLARLRDRIASLRAEVGRPIGHLGVAIPGMASRDERSVAWLPAEKLALEGVNFADALGWPRAVPVLNDAHAALLGEVWCGGATSKRDVVMLTLGTGVGGAILCDGKLVRGANRRAGHLGHIGIGTDAPPGICGMPGSLEHSIGDVSIARRSNGRFTKTRALVVAARAGDADAARMWDRSLKDLAYAIASFINMLDPEVIVISGGIAKAGDDLFLPLAKHLASIEWRPTGTGVPIVPAALGEWAGAIGAASRALGITK